jgi:HAE1 family hydrophobic/amphiphilic exporter-1
MALATGEGAEIRAPMALTVIGGLLGATILTLLVIPSLYAVVSRAKARV